MRFSSIVNIEVITTSLEYLRNMNISGEWNFKKSDDNHFGDTGIEYIFFFLFSEKLSFLTRYPPILNISFFIESKSIWFEWEFKKRIVEVYLYNLKSEGKFTFST